MSKSRMRVAANERQVKTQGLPWRPLLLDDERKWSAYQKIIADPALLAEARKPAGVAADI